MITFVAKLWRLLREKECGMTEEVWYGLQCKPKGTSSDEWDDFSTKYATSIKRARTGFNYFKEEYPELDLRVVKITTEVVLMEYDELLTKGAKLFELIGGELNKLSEAHIRKEREQYRRNEDFLEICIALVLFAQFLDLNLDDLR